IEQSRTPYFSFKDIDENKPTGSIRIRVETIHYFLTRYVEDLKRRRVGVREVSQRLAEYERRLREQLLLEQELAGLAESQRGKPLPGRLLPMYGRDGEARGSGQDACM